MPGLDVIEVICKKLGHGLEEVRIRALESLLSKLDRGFLHISNLLSTKDILVKLLEWFGLEPCSRQDQVLGLILKLLQEDGAQHLVAQIGAERLLLALNTVRERLPSELCPLLDDIAGLVQRAQTIQAQCDDDEPETKVENDNSERRSSEKCASHSDDGDIDISLQDALRQNGDSADPLIMPRVHSNFEIVSSSNVFKHLLLPWQPLVSTDCHVLIAVQESLGSDKDLPQLIHTCSFLIDVMMRDFPAEVFIQRPAIILTFMRLLKTSFLSNNLQLAKMIIACLTTLTIALRSRIRYYQDPNMANLIQEKHPLHDEDTLSSRESAEQSLQSTNHDDPADFETQVQTSGTEWSQNSQERSVSPALSQTHSQPMSLPHSDDEPEGFHCRTNQVFAVPKVRSESDDSSSLRHKQCSVPQYCVLSMRHVLPLVDAVPGVCVLLSQLSHLFTACVTPQLWFAPAVDLVAADIATHFHEMLGLLGESLQRDRSQTLSRLAQIQLLAVTRHLLRHTVPLEAADRCLPRQLKTALCSTLLDGPLHAFFPTLHSDLLQYTQVFKNVHDMDSVKVFENTLSMAESLSSAAKLLSQSDISNGSKFVQSAVCALASLSIHHNMRFISLTLDACSKFRPKWVLSDGELRALSSILLKMLAHEDMRIRQKTYSHLQRLVLDLLSVKTPRQSPGEALAFVLFDTSVLLEIVTHGVSSSNHMVQQSAEDVILHTLKGKLLLGKSVWTKFLSCLIPVLPLLQCWADKPSALGRSIMTMFNPDVGSQMNLVTSELLKGNVRLLFSRDEHIRGEALSRIVWLLTREENAFDKLPHISSLHSCVTESICILDRHVDVFQSVPEEPFYQESSLLQVLDIAQSETVQPRIVSSAMSQLAVMLEDLRLHEVFLSRGGLQTVVNVLHAAISDKHQTVFPDTIVPAVIVLRNLCFHHSFTRHHLSQDINIFFSVLRGLMMFPSDSRLRINASQLLALLSYSELLISSSPRSLSDGCVVRALSIPDLISKRMTLPFVCPAHWRTSHFTEPIVTDILLRNDACRVFLATAWNLSFFKSELSPLLWTLKGPYPVAVVTSLKTFSEALILTDRDLRVLQASAMLNTCHRQLDEIKSAATHEDVVKSLSLLDSILALFRLVRTRGDLMKDAVSDVDHFEKQYRSLPWRRAFRRFLMAAPASSDDQQLLICVLQFLLSHVRTLQLIDTNSRDHMWLFNLLKHPSQPLPNLFQLAARTGYAGDSEVPHELAHLPKWKELCKELLSIVAECARLERHVTKRPQTEEDQGVSLRDKGHKNRESKYFRKNRKRKSREKSSGESIPSDLERAGRWVDEVVSNVIDEEDCDQNTGWIYVIHSVVSCLKSSDSQHFYNLAYLDWLLWALVHLTCKPGWSADLEEPDAFFRELLTVLMELIQAFHLECGKGGSSCMGLSITRGVALCLNHISSEMQHSRQLKGWEALWESAVSRRDGTWLPSLFRSREPVVRAAALQLLASLASTAKGCNLVTKAIAPEPEIWMPALYFLLDHDEASLVREEAANVLTNFVMHCTQRHENVPLGGELLQQQVMESNFLSDLLLVLERLSMGNTCESHSCIRGMAGISLLHWAIGSVAESSIAHLPSDQHILVFKQPDSAASSVDSQQVERRPVPTTPAFLKSLCNFINAVINTSRDTVLAMAEKNVVSHLFRCIGPVPSFDCENTRGVLLYCDTLQMYASMCRIMSRCAASHEESRHRLLRQPDLAHKLLLLLDPTLFSLSTRGMQRLRDQLWTEVLWLISALFSPLDDGKESWYSAFHSALVRSHAEPLVSVLTVALSGSTLTDLQRAALACIQSVLSHPASREGQPFAVLLDNTDVDFNSSLPTDVKINLKNSIGADLCHSLLALYDVHSLQIGLNNNLKVTDVRFGWRAQRASVIGALSSLLNVSSAAKQVALNQGFVELLCTQLGSIQTYLTMEPGETMKRLATKKKVCPILEDIELIFELVNSLVLRNTDAKRLAAEVGVTDVIHKLWSWCLHQPSLLLCALRLLLTLTSECIPASHSLVLTTTVPGLGLRRAPSGQSLLHALVALVLRETELASCSHDRNVLDVSCSVLLNSFHVPECRTALAKSNLIRATHFLSLSIKRNKQWKHVEMMWLTILVQFSAFQEGQTLIPKVPDMLDYLLHLAEGHRTNSKYALQVLRNISFCQINRPRLLSSDQFLHLMNKKLCDGETDEQVAAAATLWALTANNQKGKLTVKCAGTDIHILDALRKLAVSHRTGADYVAQLLNCILRTLRSEPGHCVS